jgi:hypothetical protein
MAMKNSKNSSSSKPKSSSVTRTSTPVRNSAIPKAVKASPAGNGAPSQEQIAKRAFELYASGVAGSQTDHWFQAERELRQSI